MRNLTILVAAISIGLLLVSCGGQQAAPSTPAAPPPPAPVAPVTPPAVTSIDAKALFASTCAMCHGQTRQGIPNLASALTPTTLGQKSDDEIRNTILKGSPNTAMAGFEGRLSSAEIDALIQLIKRTSP